MFTLFQQCHEEELVIVVLASQYNEEFTLKDHIIMAVPSNSRIKDLKLRIQGATGVTENRVMLLYCGEVLCDPQAPVPADAYEAPEILDEDMETYKPRICMMVLADPVIHTIVEEPDAERDVASNAGDGAHGRDKHRKKIKTKGQFDLAGELAAVQCEGFKDVLTREGYDNEGSFGSMTMDTLRGPGLWIPLAAARRIHGVCLKVNKRLKQKDNTGGRNHYRNIDVNNASSAAGADTDSRPMSGHRRESTNPGSEEGGVGADHADDAKDGAQHAALKSKAYARREHEAEVIRQKKEAREQAELVRQGKIRKKTDAAKQHSEELERRIAEIRLRCAREDEENAADFDEITGILYSSYQRLRAVNEGRTSGGEAPRAASAGGVAPGSRLGAELAITPGSSPSRVLRALRTSASSASFSGSGIRDATTALESPLSRRSQQHRLTPFCCGKHEAAVVSNREAYFAHRRTLRSAELRVMLDHIPTSSSGYVTSHSLRAVAEMYLKSYHGMPPRSEDPQLVVQSVEHARLDLAEQRAKVLCVRPREVLSENLHSVLPVIWYCPARFIEGFADLLEQLDRERVAPVDS